MNSMLRSKMVEIIYQDYRMEGLIAYLLCFLIEVLLYAAGNTVLLKSPDSTKRRMFAAGAFILLFHAAPSYFLNSEHFASTLIGDGIWIISSFCAGYFILRQSAKFALQTALFCRLLRYACGIPIGIMMDFFSPSMFFPEDPRLILSIIIKTLLTVVLVVPVFWLLKCLRQKRAAQWERIMLWISCGSLIMALIECVYRYYQFPPYYNLSQMHNLKDVIGYVVSRISAPVWSMLSLVLWGILILLMIRAVKSRQSYRRMTEAISTTEQELKRTEQEYRSMSILRHDYRNMIGCVQKLLQEGKTDEAQRFLTSVQQDMLSDTELLKCSSAPVNAVINAKLGDASDIASTCRITASIPEELEYDLSMILANLLDNAVRASRKLTSGREIRVSITETDGYLQLTVKNRIAASVLSANPRLLTDKEDASQHGLGLQSVRMLAQRHEGMLDLYEENSMFVASVLLMKPSHGGQNGHMGAEPLHT